MPKTDIGTRIIEAFRNSQGRWRTVGGLSRELEIPEQDILEFIHSHKEWFEEAKSTSESLAPPTGSTFVSLSDRKLH